jgi:hypothetical protein
MATAGAKFDGEPRLCSVATKSGTGEAPHHCGDRDAIELNQRMIRA